MTRDEAARLLNVKPNVQRREVDTTFTSLRCHYVSQLQLSTQPHERDAAVRAIGLIQEAYITLTGQSAADAVPPAKPASGPASEEIPRVSLGGRRVIPKRRQVAGSSPLRGFWQKCRIHVRVTWPSSFAPGKLTQETKVAYAICAGVCLAAIIMLIWTR